MSGEPLLYVEIVARERDRALELRDSAREIADQRMHEIQKLRDALERAVSDRDAARRSSDDLERERNDLWSKLRDSRDLIERLEKPLRVLAQRPDGDPVGYLAREALFRR